MNLPGRNCGLALGLAASVAVCAAPARGATGSADVHAYAAYGSPVERWQIGGQISLVEDAFTGIPGAFPDPTNQAVVDALAGLGVQIGAPFVATLQFDPSANGVFNPYDQSIDFPGAGAVLGFGSGGLGFPSSDPGNAQAFVPQSPEDGLPSLLFLTDVSLPSSSGVARPVMPEHGEVLLLAGPGLDFSSLLPSSPIDPALLDPNSYVQVRGEIDVANPLPTGPADIVVPFIVQGTITSIVPAPEPAGLDLLAVMVGLLSHRRICKGL